jgi:hypothetical protein
MVRAQRRHLAQPQAATAQTELDQRVVMAVDLALKQGHRISRCGVCGGPEIHSKERPASRCWRCGAFRETASVANAAKRCRCLRCRRIFRSVVSWKYCEPCRESVAKRAAQQARRANGRTRDAKRSRNRESQLLRGHPEA